MARTEQLDADRQDSAAQRYTALLDATSVSCCLCRTLSLLPASRSPVLDALLCGCARELGSRLPDREDASRSGDPRLRIQSGPWQRSAHQRRAQLRPVRRRREGQAPGRTRRAPEGRRAAHRSARSVQAPTANRGLDGKATGFFGRRRRSASASRQRRNAPERARASGSTTRCPRSSGHPLIDRDLLQQLPPHQHCRSGTDEPCRSVAQRRARMLRQHRSGRTQQSIAALKRSAGMVDDLVGLIPLRSPRRRPSARRLRDHMIERARKQLGIVVEQAHDLALGQIGPRRRPPRSQD